MNRNGYYKVSCDSTSTYLTYVPSEGTGTDIPLEKLIAYLDKKGVTYGNVTDLKRYAEEAKTGAKVKISDITVIPFAGWCEYSNLKYITLSMTMYPPIDGFKKLTKEDVMSDLKNMKVCYGIDEKIIEQMIAEERYYENVLIAKALAPVEGKDAELNYKFNPELKATPTINEDGSVDFHQLDMINHVTEGDVVAEIIPEDPGKPGMNIMGVKIDQRKVHKKSFKFGRNLKVSDDGLQLITMVTGHVTLEGDKIFVSDEYDVRTDVDNSTGDITYNGNVRVRGSVRAGFKINATGNVTIDGVVEGAEIYAGGDIILARGILGMNKGILKAGGNIVSTYLENATASADKNLEADAILHSKVTVGGAIDVHGKNGYIIGGEVRAGSLIKAKNIGSSMGTNTVIAVGTNPELVSKINGYKQQIISLTQDRVKLNQIVELLKQKLAVDGKLDVAKLEYLQKSMNNINIIEEQLAEAKTQYSSLSALVCEDSDARIKIQGSIFPGVKMEFGDQSMFVRDKNDFCQYQKKGADIVRGSL